jgi:acyl-CoA reductase-like NAD-dependent aldehyde dehydrogenase
LLPPARHSATTHGRRTASFAFARWELATHFEERRDEIVLMLARENGKILEEAGFEVDSIAPSLRYYAGLPSRCRLCI